MQGMGTPQDNVDQGRPWERAATRTAILAAARRVAERDGVLDMSLTNVANEAGFAPTSVYAYFTSKNDLLLAVISDDLATLARAMRGTVGDQDDESMGGAMHGAAPMLLLPHALAADGQTEQSLAQQQSIPIDPPKSAIAPADVSQPGAGLLPEHAEEQARRMPVAERRDQIQTIPPAAPAGTAEAISRLQDTVARLEARPVDAWLERRLREFERGLAVLEARHGERTGGEASIDDRLGVLRQSLEHLESRLLTAAEESARNLNHRLDASETRLLEIVSDMHADGSQLAKRVSALETTSFTSHLPPFGSADVPPPLQDSPTPHEPHALPQDGAPDDSVKAAPDVSAPSYLTAARRSAQAAAVPHDEPMQRIPRKQSRMVFHAAAGSLVLFVAVLAGVGWLLRDQAMNVEPARAPARMVQPHLAHRASTPVSSIIVQNDSQVRLRKWAEAGNTGAELLIGLEYLNGSGVARNDTGAYQWLARAAAKGQPLAQYNLGMLCENGRGVRADAVQAFQWYGSAALRGNRRAMHSLAIAYADGLGTTKNLPEAAHWFERAATLGAVNSQFNLAVLYERGLGVKQSLVDAYKWYAIAAAQGDRESQARIAALTSSLPSVDLDGARNEAVAFKPETVDAAANFAPRPETLQ
jgi:TPR repeat protein/AcrR family transcriptional regulator